MVSAWSTVIFGKGVSDLCVKRKTEVVRGCEQG
jgi:hypothetical protein